MASEREGLVWKMKERKAVEPDPLLEKDAAASRKPKTEPRLGREIQTRIGHHLRAMYDDVVSQGVPDRFVDLLRKLDEGREGPSE